MSNKKKIRDLERLLQRTNLPENVRNEKLEQLKELKGTSRKSKEALRMQDMYKKVKFVEKRKVIRKLEQFDRKEKDGEVDSAL